jgi:hypothetical protein
LLVICPEEYSIFLTQGLLSIIFPDILSNIIYQIMKLYEFTLNTFSLEGSVVYADTFENNLASKYGQDDPRRNIYNYRGLNCIYVPGSINLSRDSQFLVELLFYQAPFGSDYRFVLANGLYNGRVRLHLLNISQLHYVCTGTTLANVRSPAFYKYDVGHQEILPDNHSYVEYIQRPLDSTHYRDYLIPAGEITIPNYQVTNNIYFESNSYRIPYNPSAMDHSNKFLYLLENNTVIPLGNSGEYRLNPDYILKEIYANQLREKYNFPKRNTR